MSDNADLTLVVGDADRTLVVGDADLTVPYENALSNFPAINESLRYLRAIDCKLTTVIDFLVTLFTCIAINSGK
jgi:hypothetical protein